MVIDTPSGSHPLSYRCFILVFDALFRFLDFEMARMVLVTVESLRCSLGSHLEAHTRQEIHLNGMSGVPHRLVHRYCWVRSSGTMTLLDQMPHRLDSLLLNSAFQGNVRRCGKVAFPLAGFPTFHCFVFLLCFYPSPACLVRNLGYGIKADFQGVMRWSWCLKVQESVHRESSFFTLEPCSGTKGTSTMHVLLERSEWVRRYAICATAYW